eukprot:SAG31_NODE_189_length_20842_cov_12.518151_8_plen_160_part_00
MAAAAAGCGGLLSRGRPAVAPEGSDRVLPWGCPTVTVGCCCGGVGGGSGGGGGGGGDCGGPVSGLWSTLRRPTVAPGGSNRVPQRSWSWSLSQLDQQVSNPEAVAGGRGQGPGLHSPSGLGPNLLARGGSAPGNRGRSLRPPPPEGDDGERARQREVHH